MTPTQQLVQTIVVVLIFIPVFWQIRRKVRDGRLAPTARRTSHHSRTYIVVISALNALVVLGFVVGAVFYAVDGEWSMVLTLLLLAGLISTFVWLLARQGSELRREGLPDRAPSIAQRSMSRPRRAVAYTSGASAGVCFFIAIGAALDREWGVAAVVLVVGALLWGVSLRLYRPARSAERAETNGR